MHYLCKKDLKVAVGLKYILMILLFSGFLYSESDCSVEGATFDRMITLENDDISGQKASFEDARLPLFHDVGMINDDHHSFKTKTYTHFLFNKNYKNKIFNGLYTANTVVNNYILPLRYYLYALEKIVI